MARGVPSSEILSKLPTQGTISKAIVTGRSRQETIFNTGGLHLRKIKERSTRIIPFLYDLEKYNNKQILKLNEDRKNLLMDIAKQIYVYSMSYREGAKIINKKVYGRKITPMGLREIFLNNGIIKYADENKQKKYKKENKSIIDVNIILKQRKKELVKAQANYWAYKSKVLKKEKNLIDIDKDDKTRFEFYTPRCLNGKKISEHYKKLISLLPYPNDLVIEHMSPRNPRHKKYCGLHTPNNVQILPKRLNALKSDMDWEEWQDYLITKDQEKTVSFFQYCIQELSKHNLKFKKVYNNNLKSWEYISCIDKSKLLMNNVDMFRKDISC